VPHICQNPRNSNFIINDLQTMRGRYPKPLKVQQAEGDPRKKGTKKLDQQVAAQITVQRGLPDAPEFLGEEGKRVWKLWKETLESSEIDYKSSEPSLIALCLAFEKLLEANRMGDTVNMFKAMSALNTLQAPFGFTPGTLMRLGLDL
jgi:hypothetical protein